MASEINVNAQVSATKGSITLGRSLSKIVDWALARSSSGVQNIPTTAGGTAFAFGAGVTTLGWAWFVNLDAANFVQIGVQTAGPTFTPLIKLKAGEWGMFRLNPGTTVYALANTAAVDVEFGVLDD